MRVLIFAAAAGLFCASAYADGVYGIWKSEPSDQGSDAGAFIHVEIRPCSADSAKVCGKIIDAFNGTPERYDEVVGKAIIEDMAETGSNLWEGGTIWAPDMDLTSSRSHSELVLEGTQLKVSGCVIGGLICRNQVWSRLN